MAFKARIAGREAPAAARPSIDVSQRRAA